MTVSSPPTLSTPEVDQRVTDALGRVDQSAQLPSARRRRRLRDLLRPEANGDQDTW